MVVDMLLRVAEDVRNQDLTAGDAKAITAALGKALDGLWKEREASQRSSDLMPMPSMSLEDELADAPH
jgi:hypothetical protein